MEQEIFVDSFYLFSESNSNRLVRVVWNPLGTFARDLNDAVLQQDRFKVCDFYEPFD